MAVSPARAAAFDVLLRVETEDAYAGELLHSARLDELARGDRALATEIVMGVLRWQSALDRVLQEASFTPLPKLDAAVRVALRMAVYQRNHLERVPDHAALNESVELVKRAKKKSAVPFANAVLRKVFRAPRPRTYGTMPRPEGELTESDRLELLARAYAHPRRLVERWTKQFGMERTRAILEHDQRPPETTLRVADPALAEELARDGIELAPGTLLTSARRVVGGEVTQTAAFRAGRVHIQDEASQLVALLVGRGERVLDCCAAPGGKTAAIAERNPSATIVAAELHPHRAALTRERVRAPNVEVITADAKQLPARGDFDRVLADVPCSGTGTLARNPEIKWRLRPEKLRELQREQAAILAAALAQLRPGGKLVYSTCSLEREEDEDVVEQALRGRGDVALLDIRDELRALQQEGELAWPELDSLVSGSFLRTLPGVHPCDGFFAAVLRRTKNN